MQAAPLITLATSAFSVITQMRAAGAQEDAAAESRRLAELNAQYLEQESREEERRLRYQSEREQATARARVAASGVTMQGSPGLYLEEMQKVLGQEIDWLRRSTELRKEQEQFGGEIAYRTGLERARSTRVRGIQSGIAGFGRFGEQMGWWQQ